jgi:hypothetical protein
LIIHGADYYRGMTFTTAELVTKQMVDASSQVDILEHQISPAASAVTIAILRRLQDQYRDLAASLGVALKLLAAT